MGAGTFFVAQQLNSRTSEYAEYLGRRQDQFQDSMSRLSMPLLILGSLTVLGSGTLLLLSLKPGKEEDSDAIKALMDTCGIQRDVGEPLKKLQNAIGSMRLELMEAKKRERSIIERAVDVICIVDIDSKFLSVSKAAQNAWGYAPSELEGRLLTDLLVSENTNNILNSILGSAKSIDKIVFECQLRRKDSSLIDVIWTAHWSASDGGLFCIVHDITERKRAEQLLADSELRLRRTLESLPVGVLIIEQDGKIEFSNGAACKMFGSSSSELQRFSLESKIAVTEAIGLTGASSSEVSAVEQNQPATDAQNDVLRAKGVATRDDGTNFPVELSECSIKFGSEEKKIAVFIDKTAEHQLEQVKREFMAMVTHEVRTPISSVYGIVALLEAGALGQLTDKGVELTRGVKATCKRVLRLVGDLLDIEKIQAGKFELAQKDVSLRYALETSFDNVKSLAMEKKIEIELPQTELCCWADEDRLVQVIVNLLGNAIKYSPENSKIDVRVEDLGEQLKVFVRDQGRGIPEDKLGKIFGRYEQVDLADSKKMGGSGLGLAISKAIILEHKGDIGVESKFGDGSTFWFKVPKTEDEFTAQAKLQAPSLKV